jgi:hypothetical protein
MGKIITSLYLVLLISPAVFADVYPEVYLYDSNTPLEVTDSNSSQAEYADIMVGTRLSVIVKSDSNDPWVDGGALYAKDANLAYGTLFARDYNETTIDWEGSHLEAAGEEAEVKEVENSQMQGFQLFPGSTNRTAGDWFIIDYNSTDPNIYRLGFYDFAVSFMEPVYEMFFNQVKTRDFNTDTIVDFEDFAVLASYWQKDNCSASGWCEGADLDEDGNVNFYDLKAFVRFWLEQTE